MLQRKIVTRPLIVLTAVLGVTFSSPDSEAKGCKGAIVGDIGGNIAGHEKIGAVAG